MMQRLAEELRMFSRTQHKIFAAQVAGTPDTPVFPEHYQHKKLDNNAAAAKYNKYITGARNENETAGKNDLVQVACMKAIVAEANEKIRNLYKAVLQQPVPDA